MKSKKSVMASLLLLTWVFVVVAFYYIVHKPFTASNLLAVGRALAGLGGATLVVALGIGLGRRLLGYLSGVGGVLSLRPEPQAEGLPKGGLEVFVLSAAVGLGALALVTLALGLLGWLCPWVFWALTLAGLFVCRDSLGKVLLVALGDPAWHLRSRFERILAAYCALMLIVALLWALTPPTAWDGLVYHLTGPKLYLATGRISHPLDLPYLGFPQLMEHLFTWGMGLAGERAAAAIHWFYGLLVALALVAAGRRWLGGAAGWLAAAVYLSAPTIVLLAGWPYVDLALLLYTTLAFFALLRWTEAGGKWLALSGVLAGLALSTKYTAAPLLPALILALLVAQVRHSPFAIRSFVHSSIRPFVHSFIVALAVWSPWLIKNLLLTGNPTYPFFFGGAYWDGWRAWWYDRPGTGLAYTAPWKLLTALWDATVWGMEGGATYSATIGPLFLAFLPLLVLSWRRMSAARRRWLASALAFCGVLYIFWLWGVARTALLFQTRLLFPAFGILALMVAAAMEGLRTLPRRPLDLAWLARAVVVSVLALTLVGMLFSTVQQRPLEVLLGFESRDDFLTRRLGWYYAAVEYINRELPLDAVVLFLWEPRSYHCQVDCRPDAILDRFVHTTHLYGHDADDIAAVWRAEGITHVLLHRAGLEFILEDQFDPVTPNDQRVLDELVARHLTPVENFGSAYELYRLEEISNEPQP